jgi:hypothetical protein
MTGKTGGRTFNECREEEKVEKAKTHEGIYSKTYSGDIKQVGETREREDLCQSGISHPMQLWHIPAARLIYLHVYIRIYVCIFTRIQRQVKKGRDNHP